MASCSVTDITTDFLGKGTEQNKGRDLIKWKENEGQYRIPLAKTQRAKIAIDEITQVARSYGVETPGQMYDIVRVPYNLTPGKNETHDYLIRTGKGYFQILVENEAFISEFQQKYDQDRNQNLQEELFFPERLVQDVSESFNMSPEFFDLGTQEDFANFLVEQDKLGDLDYMQSDEAYEEFKFYMIEKLQKEDMRDVMQEDYAPDEGSPNTQYENTRSDQGNMDDQTLRNVVGLKKYVEHKKKLLQNLKDNLQKYRKLNKGKESNLDYIEKVADFYDVIDQITAEVGQLTATDAQTVFADIITEMEHLSSSLANLDTFKTENHDILARLDILANLILGQNIDGSKASDLAVMFDSTGISGYNDIRSSMVDLQNKYSDFLFEIAKNALLSDHIFVEVQNQLDDNQVAAMVASIKDAGKDINMLQSLLLGINSNNDSVITKTLYNIYQMNIRKVEQSVLKTEGSLEELQAVLHKEGFDISKFYSRDANGVKTGRLISKFTNSWFNAVSNLLSIRSDFDSTNDLLKPGKFNELMSWHEKNAVFVDIRKIAEFKDMYGDEFGSYFKFSPQEMAEYESTLRDVLGRTYDSVIKQQLESLENFFKYEESQLIRSNKWANKNITASNPFAFLNNYYDNDGQNRRQPLSAEVDGEMKDTFNTGRYNQFIPLKNTKDSMGNFEESGFYDAVFERDFETNDKAFQAQQHFQTLLSEHINPAYSIMGRDISALQLPMERKSLGEVFARARADGVLPAIKASTQHLINTWKDNWYEYRSQAGNQGIVANYSDAAMREIKTLKSAMRLQSYETLLVKARELGLIFSENTNKNEIIDAIARSEVIPRFSDDIFKNVLSVSKKASVQRARQDTAFISKLLYNQFMQGDGAKRLRSAQKFDSWIKVQIYGHKNLDSFEVETSETGGMKKQAKLFRRFSEADKALEKIFKEVSTGEIGNDIHFREGDYRFFQKVNEHTGENEYFQKREVLTEEEVAAGSETEVIKISRQEFQDFLNGHLQNKIDNLGLSMTFSSFVSGVLGNLSKSFLGYNIKAGLKNRLEGVLVNTAVDADGIYWTTGNNRHSTRILTSANLVRISDGKLGFNSRAKKKQLESIDRLVRALGVLQDRRDFRDKKNQVSNYDGKTEALNVYNFAVGMPEYKNQIEIMLNVLQDHVIMNYKGERTGFVNGDGYMREGGNIMENGEKGTGKILEKENYMPAYKPGTLELRDEYKYTREAFNEDGTLKTGDLSAFINKDNIGLETFQVFDVVNGKTEGSNAIHHLNLKVQDTINKTHGNYSAMDSQVFMNNDWGRFVMSFKRHAPELINQRLGTFGTDIVQGKSEYEGRLRRLLKNPGAAGVFASALLLTHFGPLIALAGLGIGAFGFIAQKMGVRYFGMEKVMDASTNLRSALGMLQEIVVRTMDFPLVLLHSKHQFQDAKMLENRFLTKLEQDKTLSKEEIGAIRGMAQEASMYIATILFILLGKSILSGDDDDEEKKQKRNFIDNYGNQLLDSFSTFTNPKSLWEDNTSILLLATINNTARWLDGVNDYYTKGKGSHRDNFYNFMKAQPLVPAFTQVIKPLKERGGLERLVMDEKEYNTGQWFDEYTKSPEKRAQERIRNERARIKEEMIKEILPMFKEEYSHGVAKVKAKDFATKIMATHPTRKSSDESYQDVLNRSDFKKLKKEAKDFAKDYIDERGLPEMD